MYPYNYNTPKGYHKFGTLTSFRVMYDGDEIKWEGASYLWWQWEFEINLWFHPVSGAGTGNYIVWRFKFVGGDVIVVTITYSDNTKKTHYESNIGGDFKIVMYELADYKTVVKVNLYNHEWWNPGALRVDYFGVLYN